MPARASARSEERVEVESGEQLSGTRNGRHVGARTPDLYRVKSAVKPLQPFSCLAFPFSHCAKTAPKQPVFGDELVTSFVLVSASKHHSLLKGFWHTARARDQ